MMKQVCVFWTFLIVSAGPLYAQQEALGKFSFDSLFFHPRVEYSETQKGQFNTDTWGIKGSWSLPPSLSIHLIAGSSALTSPMSFYEAPARRSLDMVEYYAQYNLEGSKVEIGQVKLPVGFWGSKGAAEHSMQRSLIYQKGMVNIRDHGLAFESVFGAFKNRWVVHSGESGPDRDQQWSFSGQWQFQDSEGFFLGMTGQVGRIDDYTPTAGAASRLPGYTVGKGVRHRLGNLYLGWVKPSSLWIFEGFWGGWNPDAEERQFFNYLLEVTSFVSREVPVFFRVDRWDARNWLQSLDETQWSLGAGWMAPYQNSLMLLTLRVHQMTGLPSNHSAVLSWRLRSKSPHPLTRTL